MVTLKFNGSDGKSTYNTNGTDANGGRLIQISLQRVGEVVRVSYPGGSCSIQSSGLECIDVYARGGRGYDGYYGQSGSAGRAGSAGYNGGKGSCGGMGGTGERGQDGSPGGDGGNGGHGGNVEYIVGSDDMDLLTLAGNTYVGGGDGGAGGRGGSGGAGGPGGPGGAGCQWTESYWNSSTKRNDTIYKSTPAGCTGLRGDNGSSGRNGSDGKNGKMGTLVFVINDGPHKGRYANIFDLRFSFSVSPSLPFFEPGESFTVASITVRNVGAMPSPSKNSFMWSCVKDGRWLKPRAGSCWQLSESVPAGKTYVLNAECAIVDISSDENNLVVDTSFRATAEISMTFHLPRVPEYQRKTDKHEIKLAYPVDLSPWVGRRSLARGEELPLTIGTTNSGGREVGVLSTSKRPVRLIFDCITNGVLYLNASKAYRAQQLREVDVSPGCIGSSRRSLQSGFLSFDCSELTVADFVPITITATLSLGSLKDHSRLFAIQKRTFSFMFSETYTMDLHSNIILISNSMIGPQATAKFKELARALNTNLSMWNVSLYGGIKLSHNTDILHLKSQLLEEKVKQEQQEEQERIARIEIDRELRFQLDQRVYETMVAYDRDGYNNDDFEDGTVRVRHCEQFGGNEATEEVESLKKILDMSLEDVMRNDRHDYEEEEEEEEEISGTDDTTAFDKYNNQLSLPLCEQFRDKIVIIMNNAHINENGGIVRAMDYIAPHELMHSAKLYNTRFYLFGGPVLDWSSAFLPLPMRADLEMSSDVKNHEHSGIDSFATDKIMCSDGRADVRDWCVVGSRCMSWNTPNENKFVRKMKTVASLAQKRFPNMRFMVVHKFLPEELDGSVRKNWRAGFMELQGCLSLTQAHVVHRHDISDFIDVADYYALVKLLPFEQKILLLVSMYGSGLVALFSSDITRIIGLDLLPRSILSDLIEELYLFRAESITSVSLLHHMNFFISYKFLSLIRNSESEINSKLLSLFLEYSYLAKKLIPTGVFSLFKKKKFLKTCHEIIQHRIKRLFGDEADAAAIHQKPLFKEKYGHMKREEIFQLFCRRDSAIWCQDNWIGGDVDNVFDADQLQRSIATHIRGTQQCSIRTEASVFHDNQARDAAINDVESRVLVTS